MVEVRSPSPRRIGYNARNNSSDCQCTEEKDDQDMFHVSHRMPNQNSEKICKARKK